MGIWKFDPYHTQVEFSAKHLGMMTVRGHFAEVTATGDIHPEKPELSTIGRRFRRRAFAPTTSSATKTFCRPTFWKAKSIRP